MFTIASMDDDNNRITGCKPKLGSAASRLAASTVVWTFETGGRLDDLATLSDRSMTHGGYELIRKYGTVL